VFADGLRNEVGLAFDRHGILWGVQTGPDRLDRADLGGAVISEDNPAELLHAFRQEALHYGYPYCWMEYNLPRENGGLGPGTMWTWPTFMVTVTDEDCRNTSRYMPAELAMQGHSSPLGMTFYEYKPQEELVAIGCTSGGAFPEWMDGYAFIAFHGSWNREIPTGYKVVYVPMNATTGQVAADDAIDLLAHGGSSGGAQWPDGFRPVDVDFDECGRLLVSSDGTDGFGTKVVRIEYNDPPPTNNTTTTLESTTPASSSSSTIAPHQTNSTLEKSTAPTSSGSLRYCVHSSLLLPTLISMMIITRGIIR
jgi:glucose/arabinose dehydrogenase